MTLIEAHNTGEEAFQAILHHELAKISKWEPVAALGEDTEGVHQMRVGLRRMRSALTLFRPIIPRKITKPLATEMRWAAMELDRARDLDVYIAENFTDKELSHSKKALLEIARVHRGMAYRQVNELIQSERYDSLKRQLHEWLKSNAWREVLSARERAALEGDVTPFAARVLEHHRHRVIKSGRHIQKLGNAELHQLRIDCKKLRYAAEFFSALYGKSMVTFTGHLKKLQDILGVLHDCAVMSELQHILLEDCRDPEVWRVSEKLEKHCMHKAELLKKELKKRWKAFVRVKRPWRSYL